MTMSLQVGTTSINGVMQVPVAVILYEVPQMNGCVNVLFHHINSHPERLYSMLIAMRVKRLEVAAVSDV